MRAVNLRDEAVEIVGRPKATDVEISRATSMSIVRLRQLGYTFRAIAKFHGISHQAVQQRYKGVPEHVKRRVVSLVG